MSSLLRSFCLANKRFLFAICSKNGDWHHSHLEFQVTLIPLQQRQSNLCTFLQHRKGKFVNFVLKLSETKISGVITISDGQKKTKACFNVESILGKENSSDGLLTNFLYHDCADKNETIVQKLHKVREIKLQIAEEGHCREKRRSNPLSIKRHGHACIIS